MGRDPSALRATRFVETAGSVTVQMGRRSDAPSLSYDASLTELEGSLRVHEIVELLANLRFARVGQTHVLTIDKDVRDFFLAALRTGVRSPRK